MNEETEHWVEGEIAETDEYRIFGPPGTGKTTFLARQIEIAADKYNPETVIVASYTKTAATELTQRKLSIPRENIGTLHALCYRALGSMDIAETHAKEFNELYPEYMISETEGNKRMDEMAMEENYQTDGDRFLAAYNIHRAKMLTQDKLGMMLTGFVKKWEHWKLQNRYLDFTDMIDITFRLKSPPPGGAEIGIYDEVQDFNKLEISLIRMWGKHQRFIILAGDDDQSIYGFTGASPEAFLTPEVDQKHKRILSQSFRVPRVVQNMANKWISQVERREPKIYKPRDEEGEIVHCMKANYKNPERAVELAQQYADKGKTVMFLTACRYMLDPLKKALRDQAIPFHNPYRKTQGDWNPLGTFSTRNKDSKRISTRERVCAFLDKDPDSPFWTMENLALWTNMIKIKGVFRKGGHDRLEQTVEAFNGFLHENEEQFYRDIFEDFAYARAINRDVHWFRENLLSTKKKTVEFPMQIYLKWGRKALTEKPKIIVGTIHSVKGGEADVVILFPDISVAAMKGYRQSQENRDSIVRTFYVGMTRTRETLVLCKEATNIRMQI